MHLQWQLIDRPMAQCWWPRDQPASIQRVKLFGKCYTKYFGSNVLKLIIQVIRPKAILRCGYHVHCSFFMQQSTYPAYLFSVPLQTQAVVGSSQKLCVGHEVYEGTGIKPLAAQYFLRGSLPVYLLALQDYGCVFALMFCIKFVWQTYYQWFEAQMFYVQYSQFFIISF